MKKFALNSQLCTALSNFDKWCSNAHILLQLYSEFRVCSRHTVCTVGVTRENLAIVTMILWFQIFDNNFMISFRLWQSFYVTTWYSNDEYVKAGLSNESNGGSSSKVSIKHSTVGDLFKFLFWLWNHKLVWDLNQVGP